MASSAYQCYHESDSYSELQIESSGEDFFAALTDNVPDVVYHEDLAYVRQMLRRDAVLRGLEQNKYYELVYRLMLDGKPVYHKIRATLDLTRQSPHILLGIRNVDETIRQEKAHTQTLAHYTEDRPISGTEMTLDSEGAADFTGLSAGLYLLKQTALQSGYRRIAPLLLPLPFYSAAGVAYDYVVDGVELLAPWQVSEMTCGDWDLTLFTCTTSGDVRVAIRCVRSS